jgi:hypothetical protein
VGIIPLEVVVVTSKQAGLKMAGLQDGGATILIE